jgi:hypothetical protein
MEKGKPEEMLGANLANHAREFGADEVQHLGGRRYIARRTSDGAELRMIADEGIGSVEGEEGFEEAWENWEGRRRRRLMQEW